MSSDRRIAASRANGAKSNGPVTPEGKSRSARNACKHGLASPNATAESVCLGSENRGSLARLHQALIDEFAPATAAEALIVEEMALCRFRMHRSWSHEAALIDSSVASERERRIRRPEVFGEPIRNPTEAAAIAFSALSSAGGLPAIQRYEDRLSRQFDRCLRRLRELRAEPVEPAATDASMPNEPSPKNGHSPEPDKAGDNSPHTSNIDEAVAGRDPSSDAAPPAKESVTDTLTIGPEKPPPLRS